MKKIKCLALLGASVLLAGCTVVIHHTADDRTYQYPVESLAVNYHSLNMYAGDSVQLGVRVNPIKATGASLVYSSSNEEIATVSADGTITALKPGAVTIKVAYELDQTINYEVPVQIVNKIVIGNENRTALDTKMDAMLAYQTEHIPTVDKASCYRYLVDGIYKNGVLQEQVREDETYTISYSDAYFYIGGHEEDIKVEGGSPESVDWGWIFQTDASYGTHCYHIMGSLKNRLNLSTQDYIGRDRIDAVIDVIKAFFREQTIALYDRPALWSLGTDDLGEDYTRFKRLIIAGGYNDAENVVAYTLEQNGYEFTIGNDEESDYEIPAGTKVLQDYKVTTMWKDGYVFAQEVAYTNSYDLGEDHYDEKVSIRMTCYVNDDVHIEFPNDKEYTEVADIFDL